VPEDFAAVYVIQADPATNAFKPSGPSTAEECSAMLASWIADWRSSVGYWCVRLAEGGPIAGIGGLRLEPWGDEQVLNLYYRFAPTAWGHGYATELAQHCVSAAQGAMPDVVVQARIRQNNVASLAVAQRAGLRQTGVEPDEFGDRQILRTG
jgi:RimJ/RimL family protein N-acetyltransferase